MARMDVACIYALCQETVLLWSICQETVLLWSIDYLPLTLLRDRVHSLRPSIQASIIDNGVRA